MHLCCPRAGGQGKESLEGHFSQDPVTHITPLVQAQEDQEDMNRWQRQGWRSIGVRGCSGAERGCEPSSHTPSPATLKQPVGSWLRRGSHGAKKGDIYGLVLLRMEKALPSGMGAIFSFMFNSEILRGRGPAGTSGSSSSSSSSSSPTLKETLF